MATDSKLQKHLRGNSAFVSEKQFPDQGFIVFVDDCRLFMLPRSIASLAVHSGAGGGVSGARSGADGCRGRKQKIPTQLLIC